MTTMPRVPVESVAVPRDSLAARVVAFDDYRDAYRIGIDPEALPDVDAFARAFTRAPPRWMRGLMGVRDALVGVFGLKRGRDAPAARVGSGAGGAFVPGDFAGIFRVLERDARELLLGEDDRHLDFRVSILHEGGAVTVTTLVHFHNALGRAYFLPVAPAHRRIVPAMMRSAVTAPSR
jgi:hypothetical protein